MCHRRESILKNVVFRILNAIRYYYRNRNRNSVVPLEQIIVELHPEINHPEQTIIRPVIDTTNIQEPNNTESISIPITEQIMVPTITEPPLIEPQIIEQTAEPTIETSNAGQKIPLVTKHSATLSRNELDNKNSNKQLAIHKRSFTLDNLDQLR